MTRDYEPRGRRRIGHPVRIHRPKSIQARPLRPTSAPPVTMVDAVRRPQLDALVNRIRRRLPALLLLGVVLVAAGCTDGRRNAGGPPTTGARPSSPPVARSAASFGREAARARAALRRFITAHLDR